MLTGTAKVDFTIEDFSLPSESTSPADKLDVLDQELKKQDKQMQRWNPGITVTEQTTEIIIQTE